MFESDPSAAIDVATAAPQVLSDRDLLGRTDAVYTALGRAHLELLQLLAEADRREAWRDQGAEDVCHWVSIRYGISMWKAARWVEAARSLPSLPLIAAALASGRLGIDHVVELCRFASPETEHRLIVWASERSSGAVRRRADLERRRSRGEVMQAERDRWLRTWTTADGLHVGLDAQLPTDQGAMVELALTRLAEQMPDLPDDVEPGARRAPWEVRRADAIVQLCSGRLEPTPTATGPPSSSTSMPAPCWPKALTSRWHPTPRSRAGMCSRPPRLSVSSATPACRLHSTTPPACR
jgi:hypothetical protein